MKTPKKKKPKKKENSSLVSSLTCKKLEVTTPS